MIKNISKKLYMLVAVLLVCFYVFNISTSRNTAFALSGEETYLATNVLDDLTGSNVNGKAFDLNDYPFDEKKRPQLTHFVEYCHSYKSVLQDNFGLFVYVYNPQGLEIKTDTGRNKIGLRFNASGNYAKYNLQFLNYSNKAGYEGLLYKFRVALTNDQKKSILASLNQQKRIYEVSGIELCVGKTIEEYPVALTYNYTGYALGYGSDTATDNTLVCSVDGFKDNAYADSFEFGVVNMTEIGKERGNNLELMEKKKKDEMTNQKNDLFNYWLKMVRHSATIDNFPFVKVITDEQRPASWGADARDLCEILTITDSGEQRLAFPFFALGELIYSFVISKFTNLYYQYRFNRADNTLFMFLYKNISAFVNNQYKKIYNLYGYSPLKVKVEAGTQDGKSKLCNYYLMNKKIYSKRFSTDCYSEFFANKNKRSMVGINDLNEYMSEKARLKELMQQNSYFMNDLYNGFFNQNN